MKKYLIKIIILITFWFSFIPAVFWFDAVITSAELKNIKTNEIKSFTVYNYKSKNLLELSLLKKLDWKNIWDTILDWEINAICYESDCYLTGWISTRSYRIYPAWRLWNEKKYIPKLEREEFQINNLSLSQKYELFDYRVLKPILIEIIIFLPLNLVVFHCAWYLLFLIFYKKFNINYFKRIYLNAWLFYILSIIILYYLWHGFTNYNSGLMWLFWYFFFIGIFKFILFLISRYTIERYNKIEEEKSNLGNKILLWYWIIFLLIVGVSFLVKLLSNLF